MKDKSEKKRHRGDSRKEESTPHLEWDHCVKGCMERGGGVAYEDMEGWDPVGKDTSRLWWGALWISGIAVEKVVALTKYYPTHFNFVENIADDIAVISFSGSFGPVAINKGTTPCIASYAERIPCPQGEYWCHFHHTYDRSFVHERINWLYNMLPDAKVYLIRMLWPSLELLYMMPLRDIEELVVKKEAVSPTVAVPITTAALTPDTVDLTDDTTATTTTTTVIAADTPRKFDRLSHDVLYLDLVEENYNEGEKWHFYVAYDPHPITEDMLGRLMGCFDGSSWSINRFDIPKADAQVLVDHAQRGYMMDRQFKDAIYAHNIREILACPKCCANVSTGWYKGDFAFACPHDSDDGDDGSDDDDKSKSID